MLEKNVFTSYNPKPKSVPKIILGFSKEAVGSCNGCFSFHMKILSIFTFIFLKETATKMFTYFDNIFLHQLYSITL